MKKKSVIVAVVMASMILSACESKTETSKAEEPTVTQAPTEEATLEPEEPAQSTDDTQEATDSSSKSDNATKGSSTSSNQSTGSASNAGNAVTGSSSAASSDAGSTQSETGSTEDTQPTGVPAQYRVYEGTYFDGVIYSWSSDESKVRPYCEIDISNVTDTSFDFTIYEKDLQENRTLKFKTNTAVFTGDGTQAEFNGKGYHLVFTFPNDHSALPEVTDMQVSGISWLEGNTYCNNTIPGHEFG